jgi:hypothetical protein
LGLLVLKNTIGFKIYHLATLKSSAIANHSPQKYLHPSFGRKVKYGGRVGFGEIENLKSKVSGEFR